MLMWSAYSTEVTSAEVSFAPAAPFPPHPAVIWPRLLLLCSPHAMQITSGEITFHHVVFAYKTANPVLKGVSFHVPGAWVGPMQSVGLSSDVCRSAHTSRLQCSAVCWPLLQRWA